MSTYCVFSLNYAKRIGFSPNVYSSMLNLLIILADYVYVLKDYCTIDLIVASAMTLSVDLRKAIPTTCESDIRVINFLVF